jgi:hypothetical protein
MSGHWPRSETDPSGRRTAGATGHRITGTWCGGSSSGGPGCTEIPVSVDPNPGNFDLAEILFGNGVNAGLATGSDHLFDIWSPLGDSVGTAASTEVSSWLTDLLALF